MIPIPIVDNNTFKILQSRVMCCIVCLHFKAIELNFYGRFVLIVMSYFNRIIVLPIH